jgi:hypothetical protein
MPLTKAKADPLAISYKRWRNLKHKYLVDVVDVKNYGGKALTNYRMVVVRRVRGAEQRAWPAEVFLKTFEPIGHKVRKRTAWDILQE